MVSFENLPPGSGRVVIYNFGSQYTNLIARQIRQLGVFCEIVDPGHKINARTTAAIVLSGGPASVYEKGSPKLHPSVISSGLPVLGICYGMQILAQALGGLVQPGSKKEYGCHKLSLIDRKGELFKGAPAAFTVLMSHGDSVVKLPRGFSAAARTENCPVAVMSDASGKIYGVQFHPEVHHSQYGATILKNFLFGTAAIKPDWNMNNFIKQAAAEIRRTVKNKRVLLALSGGVDSSVLSMLLEYAIPGQTRMIFVDTGLLTSGERSRVEGFFGKYPGFETIDAKNVFLQALKGISEPERKRIIIGKTFIKIFSKAASKLSPRPHFLAQGTLYPDVIESSRGKGASATIKSHHNVGGLPKEMKFRLLEPFRLLFKDEVRLIGRELKMPGHMVNRHPLPGPALAIRCVGKITRQRIEAIRKANEIVEAEIIKAGFYDKVWQAFAVLLPVRSVGVMGDGRTYREVCSVRVVTSQDGMTAQWAVLPHQVLAKISSRIVNEIPWINKVLYDITSKPPSTIEWE